MGKVSILLAATAGCAIGFLAMAAMFASTTWRTCEDIRDGEGFKCSKCGSHTDYEPLVDFRFCPMCGSYVIRKESV